MFNADRYLDALVAASEGWTNIRFENPYSEKSTVKPYGDSPDGRKSCIIPRYSDSKKKYITEQNISYTYDRRKEFQKLMSKNNNG